MLGDMKVVTAREGKEKKKRKSLGLPLCKRTEHPTIPMQNFSSYCQCQLSKEFAMCSSDLPATVMGVCCCCCCCWLRD